MNDRQNAKFQMYQKVLDVFSENEKEYVGIPVFVNTVGDLRERVERILKVAKQQTETSSKGITEEKSSITDRLVESSMKVASPLYVYAFKIDDKNLMLKANVNKSMFYNAQDRAALTLAQIIADNANTHGDALRDYGVSNADRAELDAVIVQFREQIASPQGEIGKRKAHTNTLRETFVSADSIVYDQLDKLMIPFKTSSPEFFQLYSNARNIVNTAARRRKESPKQD
jgi:hypothetical protein